MLARGEARSREVIATQCDLWKDLFLTYGDIGKLAGGQRNWLNFLLKVDSTLKFIFFSPFQNQNSILKGKSDATNMNLDKFGSRKDAMEVNLELRDILGKIMRENPNIKKKGSVLDWVHLL